MNEEIPQLPRMNPPAYPFKDHWDYNLNNISEALSKIPDITTPTYWADWCQAFFFGGTTLHLWNEATELKIAFLSACSLREGQKVALIGKYAAESGLAPAVQSLLTQGSPMMVEEIGPQAVAALKKVHSTPNNKLQWDFNYLNSLQDNSLDRVILFGAASHVANWDGFVTQINRVLRDGGKVIIAETPLGGKEFSYALHLDAHFEGFVLRVLSGMEIKEEELPSVGTEDLTALFQPFLRWTRAFSWEGIYLFYGQKGGKEDVSSFEFPELTKEVKSFLAVKPSQKSWDFLAEPERAAWNTAVLEINKRESLNFDVWAAGNLIWIWHNNRSITDMMWSNLLVKPGDKVLLIGEIPEELGVLRELQTRTGKNGEIVCVDMIEGAYNYKDWQKKRKEHMERCGEEEWPYEFADDYPDNYFDLILLAQGVHHSNNWLRDAPRLLRALKPGHQVMAIECGFRHEMQAAREKSALLRVIGDKVIDFAFILERIFRKGAAALSPERVGRPYHDVSTAHLREAFGKYLTEINSIEWKGWILLWGYKK